MMKRTLLITTVLAGSLGHHAADYRYLTIEWQNGTKLSLAANGLTISYVDGHLQTGTTTISLAELSRMYFSATDESTTTGIKTVVTAQPSLSEADEVFDLNGRRMPKGSALPKGVYIVKKNGNTFKIQVK